MTNSAPPIPKPLERDEPAQPPVVGGRARLTAALKTRRGLAIMVVLSSVANVVNYTSSLVFSRLLEPTGFGELTSLLALSVVLAVPLGAASTVVAERVAVAHAAGDEARIRYLVRYALGHVGVLAIAVGAVYVLCIPLVVELLDIREPGPAIALAPLIVVTFLTPVTVGVLQGMERFAALGVLLFATAASRLLFGVPWTVAGGGAGGAIAGQAVGIALVSVVLLWNYRTWIIPRGSGVARSGMRRRLDLHAIAATGSFIGFALLSNLDLVLARIYLDNHDAGIYAAIATVAKVVVFLPAALAMIMAPRAAKDHAATGSGLVILRKSAALVGAITALFVLPALLFPGFVVDVMFGPGYEEAVDGVLPAVLAGGGLALLYLLATYSVAIRDRIWVLLLVGGVGVQCAAIALAHGSPVEIAWAQAVSVAVILAVNEALFRAVLPRTAR